MCWNDHWNCSSIPLYLFMYEDPLNPEGLVRFIYRYENHHRVFFDLQGQIFPARRLLPDGLAPPPGTGIVWWWSRCISGQDQLGYAIFEADPQQEAIYEILEDRSALLSSVLF